MMSELHQRLREYDKQTRQAEKRNIRDFERLVKAGVFPEKCSRCYKALNWCKFWNNGFNCEQADREIEREELTRQIEVLL